MRSIKMPPRKAAAKPAAKVTKAPAKPRAKRAPKVVVEDEGGDTTPAQPLEEVYSPLQLGVSSIFQSIQKSTHPHRKAVTQLRTVQEQCYKGTGVGATTGGGRLGEKAFGKEFIRNFNKILIVKRGEVVGDRCLRFCDMFISTIIEKGEFTRGIYAGCVY